MPFDAQLFGTAANNGQMIAEVQPGGKVNALFVDLAAVVTGRPDVKRGRSSPPQAHYRKVHPSQGILTAGRIEAGECSGSDQERLRRRG